MKVKVNITKVERAPMCLHDVVILVCLKSDMESPNGKKRRVKGHCLGRDLSEVRILPEFSCL